MTGRKLPENKNEELYLKLWIYKLPQAKREGIKAYFILNNEQPIELIANKPRSLEELIKISNFGEKKTEKYGKNIIEIIKGA